MGIKYIYTTEIDDANTQTMQEKMMMMSKKKKGK